MPHTATLTKGLLACALLLGLSAPAPAERIGSPHVFSPAHPPGSVHQGVRLLGALRLDVGRHGLPPARELSGLAWDADEELLYAISDKGYLVHLRPVIEEDRLVDVELLTSRPLISRRGTPLSAGAVDTEALVLVNGDNGVRGDSELRVSFEGEPRVARYRPDGRWLAEERLPRALARREAYAGGNLGLEAIALHPHAGLLLAPERPLAGEPAAPLTLYAQDGRRWRFAPRDPEYGGVTDLVPTPEGDLLVLERSFRNVFLPVVISVRRIAFSGEEPEGAELPVSDLALFSGAEGWAVDNFEGLAHHCDRRYFMVSDDNANALQSTLLVYFELLD